MKKVTGSYRNNCVAILVFILYYLRVRKNVDKNEMRRAFSSITQHGIYYQKCTGKL